MACMRMTACRLGSGGRSSGRQTEVGPELSDRRINERTETNLRWEQEAEREE